ncbi:hypothetical protein N8198_06165 [Gammaproteobacteria bacterium]|nr:hypothetical protein [Gammaproteobacteria bacterium]
MSANTPTCAARAEDSSSLLSLLIIFSSTTLMIATVCLMVSFLVIDPHNTASGVTPDENTLSHSAAEGMQAASTKPRSNKAPFVSQVDASEADGATQITQASEHIFDG